MADVFVSHSSIDKEVADELVSRLEEKGIKCWIAPRDILPGSEWAASINNAISEAKIMIVIYSENSASSTQVPKELTIADRKDKFIIPYMVDNTELFGSFEYFFTGAHWISADPRNNDFKIDELYGVISGVLKMDGQNVVNNTYVENVTINNGGSQQQQASSYSSYPHNTATSNPSGNYSNAKKIPNIFSTKNIIVMVAVIVAISASVYACTNNGNSKNDDTVIVANENVTSQKNRVQDTIDYTITQGDYVYVGTYSGEVADGVPDGSGKFEGTNSDGNSLIYTGEFEAGLRSGNGTTQRSFVDDEWLEQTYEGEWANDKYNGQGKGTNTYANGDVAVWEGEWVDGDFNGYGTWNITFADDELLETTYEGDWANNNFNGQGKETYTYANGDVEVWEGEFVDGDFIGYGTLNITFADDELLEVTHEGEWANGTCNGKGKLTYTYANGDVRVWEGEFVDGKTNGYGTYKLTCADDELLEQTYEGEWVDGLPNGQGKETDTYANGEIEVYEGEFKDGEFIG